MLTLRTLLLTGTAIVVLAGCATVPVANSTPQPADPNAKIRNVTATDRARYVASAQLWSEADFKERDERDLLTGPPGDGAFTARRELNGTVTFPEITCLFVEPAHKDELSGSSPKFQCGGCPDGCTIQKTVRVKYAPDADSNGEVYAEVMATRLLWALGFKSDRVYPVRVTCKNCPEDPWGVYRHFKPGKERRADRVFAEAVVEWKYDGPKIEESTWPAGGESQGFGFEEADRIRKEMPGLGASDVEWEAFRLLAAFIKHADTKPSNQRLGCESQGVKDDGTCTASILMVQDVGATFGRGAFIFGFINEGSKAKLGHWSDSHVWKDHDKCQASLSSRFTLKNPTVTDAGRAFLVSLLQGLTDAQLRDIFTASRVTERHEKVRDTNGAKRVATVDDWVREFRAKVAELAKPCGSK